MCSIPEISVTEGTLRTTRHVKQRRDTKTQTEAEPTHLTVVSESSRNQGAWTRYTLGSRSAHRQSCLQVPVLTQIPS